ncbi:MAG TPA: cytochrome b/b6 domain-containing protein [Granulicella sp.]|nr:cytochrome b/b6 domain-containing protein [Granulicella sp.]
MPDQSPSHSREDAVVLPVANDALGNAEAMPAPAAPVEPAARPVAAEAPPVARATIRLERKHPLAIRWMHWINFPVLFTMIWSGLLIYWGDSDNAYQHPHRVYRIGIGSWTLFRFFPEWFYRWLHAPFQITTGLGWHFVFMWIFAVNGLAYVTYLVVSGDWRLMVPRPGLWIATLKEAIQVTLYDLHLGRQHPPAKKYNGAQKIVYTAIVLMGAGSLATGLAIYKPTQAHYLTSLLGGYEMARWEHFWLTMGFCAFFLLHVGQVIKTGWNNFRGMVSGYEIRPADSPPYSEEINQKDSEAMKLGKDIAA